MTKPDLDAYRACTRRVTDWFVSTLEDDGTIRDELETSSPTTTPPNLLAVHRPCRGSAAHGELARRERPRRGRRFPLYRGKKGDIIQPSMQWNYINGWLTWGLGRIGRFDVSEPRGAFSRTVPRPVGEVSSPPADPDTDFAPIAGSVDMGSTCAASLGNDLLGSMGRRHQSGRFLAPRTRKTKRRPTPSTVASLRTGAPLTGFPDEQSLREHRTLRRAQAGLLVLWFRFEDLGAAAPRHRPRRLSRRARTATSAFSTVVTRTDGPHLGQRQSRVGIGRALPNHGRRSSRRAGGTLFRSHRRRSGVTTRCGTGKRFFPTTTSSRVGITIELALEFAFLLHEIVSEIDSR